MAIPSVSAPNFVSETPSMGILSWNDFTFLCGIKFCLFSWEALSEPGKYRGRCSQPTIGQSRVPDGGVAEETEGAEGVCSPTEGATVSIGQTPTTPGAPGD